MLHQCTHWKSTNNIFWIAASKSLSRFILLCVRLKFLVPIALVSHSPRPFAFPAQCLCSNSSSLRGPGLCLFIPCTPCSALLQSQRLPDSSEDYHGFLPELSPLDGIASPLMGRDAAGDQFLVVDWGRIRDGDWRWGSQGGVLFTYKSQNKRDQGDNCKTPKRKGVRREGEEPRGSALSE